jgi:hypothetical protein
MVLLHLRVPGIPTSLLVLRFLCLKGGYMVYILTVFLLMCVCVFCTWTCIFMTLLLMYTCIYSKFSMVFVLMYTCII